MLYLYLCSKFIKFVKNCSLILINQNTIYNKIFLVGVMGIYIMMEKIIFIIIIATTIIITIITIITIIVRIGVIDINTYERQ